MVDSIFHDLKRIEKSDDSVVHRKKQEDAERDARGTFGLIHGRFVLQVERNKWKTKDQENYGVRERTSATKTPHSNNN